AAVDALASFVGTRAIEQFPSYRALRLASTPLRAAQLSDFPAPTIGVDYPIVGVVDTGTDPKNKLLAPWILARENYVPTGLESYDHGTFVAGLVVHGRVLNGDPSFPVAPCKIVDVAAIPSDGSLDEDALIVLLSEVVPKYAGIVRVWNLSLGTNER